MLELRNITKHLDDRPVLRHINMCAGEGELCAVTGKKDSGRSTLLRIAGGIIRPDAGSVILDDRPVFDNRYSRQKLFYISEVPVLYQGKSLKSLTRFYGSQNVLCEWHYVDVDERTWQRNIEERNRRVRSGEGGSDYYLDEGLMGKLLSAWEPPSREEIDVWVTLERNA